MKNQGDDPEGSKAIVESVRGIHRIFQIVDLFSRKTIRELGISGPQLWALRTIRDAECTTMSDLYQRIHLHPATVSGIVDKLEEQGLASRHQASNDAAVTELRLTAPGRSLLSKAPEPPRSRLARGIELLAGDELACIHRAVRLLSRILDIPEHAGEAGQSK
jgi:DNA-binding MarR family transcriptional regulator